MNGIKKKNNKFEHIKNKLFLLKYDLYKSYLRDKSKRVLSFLQP